MMMHQCCFSICPLDASSCATSAHSAELSSRSVTYLYHEQVDQGARLVDRALETGELFELDGWKHIAPAASEGTLHLIGLLSDGGVHSRYDQLKLLFDGVSPYHHNSRPTC